MNKKYKVNSKTILKTLNVFAKTHALNAVHGCVTIAQRTVLISLSILLCMLAIQQRALAVCDSPNSPVSGTVVTCSGTTTGTFLVVNRQDITVNHTGTWNIDGVSTGAIDINSGNTSGTVINNSGELTWTNAAYGGAGNGTRALINNYSGPNTATSSVINNANTGVVNVSINTPFANGRFAAAIANQARGVGGTTTINNAGRVNLDTSVATTQLQTIVSIGRDGVFVNNADSGTISINQVNSGSVITALSLALNGGASSQALMEVNNDGVIEANGTATSSGSAVFMGPLNRDGANPASISPILRLNNTGTLRLNAGSGSVVALGVLVPNANFFINNSGNILAQGGAQNAIELASWSTDLANVSISNTGIISGDILTLDGNDSLNQSGGTITGNTDLGDGDNTFTISGGTITGDIASGVGNDDFSIIAGAINGNTDLGDGDNTITMTGGSIIGDITTGGGTDVFSITGGVLTGTVSSTAGDNEFTLSGGAINGSVLGGTDTDTFNLNAGFNQAGLLRVDGGAGDDNVNINGLSIRGFTGDDDLSKGVNFVGIEAINVQNNATLELTDDLFDAGTIGELLIDSSSTLQLAGQTLGIFAINGNVTNSGLINFQDGAAGDSTTIMGNLHNDTGASLRVDTQLDDDASATDSMIVRGDVSGQAGIFVNKIGGQGAATNNGILLVQVDGQSNADNFVLLNGPLQAGAFEYVLQQGSQVDANDWYLASSVIVNPEPKPPINKPKQAVASSNSPAQVEPLYRPAISAYSVTRSVNADVGMMQVATLHQRMGDLTAQELDEGTDWIRLLSENVSGEGKRRFDYEQDSFGVQFGHDFWNKEKPNSNEKIRSGIMVHHVLSDTKAWDSVRPEAGLAKDTGNIDTKTVGVGFYRTKLTGQESYTDTVLQLNNVKNQFTDSYGGEGKQSGVQILASIEKGKAIAHVNDYRIEGQGQLTGIHTRYDEFEDGFSKIDAQTFTTVRARLGMRVHKSEVAQDEPRLYGVANLIQDLSKTKDLKVSDNSVVSRTLNVSEEFDQTYAQLGVGAQVKTGEKSWIYTDLRYEQGIENRQSGGKINVGFKSSF